ncbi:unnamed protein product [Coffea canephora]|uniref:Uncharacterized protein n=1 Tax=Coffea canephora TaxID=49390 RepID=A0A068VBL4_COFCA|nr:unnamed protein product [Coffea canephora]
MFSYKYPIPTVLGDLLRSRRLVCAQIYSIAVSPHPKKICFKFNKIKY